MSSVPTTANRDWAAHGGTFALLWLVCWIFEAAFVTNRLGFPVGVAVAAVTAIVVAGYAWGLVWIMAWMADRRSEAKARRVVAKWFVIDLHQKLADAASHMADDAHRQGFCQLDAGSAPRFIRPDRYAGPALGPVRAWAERA